MRKSDILCNIYVVYNYVTYYVVYKYVIYYMCNSTMVERLIVLVQNPENFSKTVILNTMRGSVINGITACVTV